MVNSVLSMQDIHKTYITEMGQVVNALENINLHLERNDFVTVLGPSGCGKSTLMRIIAGLEPVTQGHIFYQGKNLQKKNREISMVFQDYSLLPWRKVIDNVTLGLEFAGVSLNKRREQGMNYLKMVGLEKFANSYPYELSGGMQQRVAIVRSLANEPQLLLMDEPFGALDAHTRLILQKELLEIWENTRKTILFVTHSVDEAIYLSDRIAVMTSSPGTIKEIIKVDIPRPRNRANPKYGILLARLLDMLGEEVKRSMRNENMEVSYEKKSQPRGSKQWVRGAGL